MQVDYYHQKQNVYGNIMWGKELGKNDTTHPVNSIQVKDNIHPLEKFRSLGYYASCFSEGDGIAIRDESEQKTPGMVADDIISCFGWDVCIKTKTKVNRVRLD
ncbi:MAG: hypothetical protein GW836_18800 [Paraglaciecola sp.]|nr:hypothetical protein [Paraglaciecola sp.]